MTKDKAFHAERKKAFDEIKAALLAELSAQAQKTKDPKLVPSLNMPDMITLQERLRWPGALHMVAVDLEKNEPLHKTFERVSGRYKAAFRKKPTPVADDFKPLSGSNGRDQAFAQLFRVIDVALRDFDDTYRDMGPGEVRNWQKKHPLPEAELRRIHKESQRQAMKDTLSDIRTLLQGLQKPAPKIPAPPKP